MFRDHCRGGNVIVERLEVRKICDRQVLDHLGVDLVQAAESRDDAGEKVSQDAVGGPGDVRDTGDRRLCLASSFSVSSIVRYLPREHHARFSDRTGSRG